MQSAGDRRSFETEPMPFGPFAALRHGVETVQELWPMRYLSKTPGNKLYRRSGDVCAFSPGTTACRISAKKLVGRSRKTLAYLVADFWIVLRHL